MIQVLDLTAGLGGRAYAFEQMGFEIAAVVEHDLENCRMISSWLEESKIINLKLNEIDIDSLPSVDLIAANYIPQSVSVSRNRRGADAEEVNYSVYKIIKTKLPEVFLLETPVISIINKRFHLEEYMQKYLEIGYVISYEVYTEYSFSGFPMAGRRGYIIGYKQSYDKSFKYPKPLYYEPKKEVSYENEETIGAWFRRINLPIDNYKEEGWYLKEGKRVRKTNLIFSGPIRETFLIDSWGPRRFTHNEFAEMKGLYPLDFNYSSNKLRMYRKILEGNNVYTLKAIADGLHRFMIDSERNDGIEVYTSKESKKKKNKRLKVIFPKYVLKGMYIKKLKGINNLELKFDKNLVAIMGVNGSGKSTILHALACVFSKYENGDDYKFSYFFTPNPHASWKDSSFSIMYYDENTENEVSKTYEKKKDRWVRYSNRPARDVYYLGVASCIPEIEIEKKTSFINYVSNNEVDKKRQEIIDDAAYILNKDYDKLLAYTAGKKKYMGVHTQGDITYSALSMGAGEQRIIKILQTVYNAHQYSLILVDEMDLLLHADAYRKLIIKLSEIAQKRHIQIIFTTHSLEMQNLGDYADIRYIEKHGDKMLVYDSIKPDLVHELSGESVKKLSIYVEDEFAAAIIYKVAESLEMLRFINVITYGSIENAFTVASGKILDQGNELIKQNIENILIVTDGDRFVAKEEKEKRINANLTGTEQDHEEKVQKALSLITQFNLPEGKSPEKYVHELLCEMNDSDECVKCAKSIMSVKDEHEWIGKIVEHIGRREYVYNHIMELIAENVHWENYVSNVREWLMLKKVEIDLPNEQMTKN